MKKPKKKNEGAQIKSEGIKFSKWSSFPKHINYIFLLYDTNNQMYTTTTTTIYVVVKANTDLQ